MEKRFVELSLLWRLHEDLWENSSVSGASALGSRAPKRRLDEWSWRWASDDYGTRSRDKTSGSCCGSEVQLVAVDQSIVTLHGEVCRFCRTILWQKTNRGICLFYCDALTGIAHVKKLCPTICLMDMVGVNVKKVLEIQSSSNPGLASSHSYTKLWSPLVVPWGYYFAQITPELG